MKNLLDVTAQFFGKKSTPQPSDIRDLMAGITTRLGEIDKRQAIIDGRERQTVLEQGDTAAVKALDREVADLKSEELALRARHSRLHHEFKAARTAEAIENASKTRARLAEAVGSIESMRSQLADAEYSLKRQTDELREQRQLAGNDPRLDLNPELAARIAETLVGNGRDNRVRSDRQRMVNEFAPPRRSTTPGSTSKSKGEIVGGAA